MNIVRKLTVGLGLGLFLFLLSPLSPAAAQEGDVDTYLCEELGIGCPGGDDLVCSTPLGAGDSGTCTVSVEPGTEVQATLTCGDESTVVFSGVADEDPFTFPFTVPDGTPTGTCTMEVLGATFDITIVGGTTLARTGSNAGPLAGLGAALAVIGGAALYGAKMRRRSLA
jgi:hypothetical protein